MEEDSKPLYVPASPQDTRIHKFLQRTNKSRSLSLATYSDLYDWSIDNTDLFWSDVWDDTDVVGLKGNHVVDTTALPPANPPWFSQAKLNWAENMLQCRAEDKVALVEAIEPQPGVDDVPSLRRISYAELYTLVSDLVSALLAHGLKPGDRVASAQEATYTLKGCYKLSNKCKGNNPLSFGVLARGRLDENVAACLAATAIGCIWVSAAADFGPEGVLERFEQVQPKIIFSVDAVVYNAKVHPHLPKLKSLLTGLSDRASLHPTVVTIHVPATGHRAALEPGWIAFENFVSLGKEKKLGRTADGEIEWARVSFDWPLWILFSSGTTGRPKPIVHRAGGMLLQSKKELVICADIQPSDVFFYYTTTGWMMWNFLVSGLSIGCTLVLYDGSPLRDPSYLWKLVDDLGITIFGTSAKYIDQLSKVYKPRESHNLSTLRHIYSTGSPLAAPLYDYVYEHIHPNVLLASITGGTDICSLFADHGDHVVITRSRGGNSGGMVMLGRSDGVLNPGGVRFGSAELYDVIDTHFAPNATHASHAIADCLAIGQSIQQGTDERVILFVKLLEGQSLTGELEKRLKTEIRTRRSARHVPAKIIQVQDIPYTLNGKRVEVPVKKIVNGAPISSINPATLRNPECLTRCGELVTVLNVIPRYLYSGGPEQLEMLYQYLDLTILRDFDVAVHVAFERWTSDTLQMPAATSG
ncbi:hypothetical protein EIP91_000671 [Steccherinum ochraceum]|uniref:AMP-dependent synthetase/ligase domain-containing protein n=1 Tax=Steccherinum ochraceum TaxID=92696 RepID=A0A4R0RFK3_9APHY|nr:hypothetical protein EIP91_000671 [Steccherinum ochraceum]